MQTAYRKRLLRRHVLASSLARWYRRESARTAYEAGRRAEYLAACHVQAFGLRAVRRARATIASRKLVARGLSRTFRRLWLRKLAQRAAAERAAAKRIAAGCDVVAFVRACRRAASRSVDSGYGH